MKYPVRLQKKRSLKHRLQQYRWEVIIPFIVIIISIIIVASMQVKPSLA